MSNVSYENNLVTTTTVLVNKEFSLEKKIGNGAGEDLCETADLPVIFSELIFFSEESLVLERQRIPRKLFSTWHLWLATPRQHRLQRKVAPLLLSVLRLACPMDR